MFDETDRTAKREGRHGLQETLRNLATGFVAGSVIGAILFTWQTVTGASGIFISLF